MARVFIGMGSNVGNRKSYLEQAFTELQQVPEIILRQCSSIYETDPVGPGDQGKYLNAVVEADVKMKLIDLLKGLKEIEYRLGRIRRRRWEEREIDLDILYYDQEIYRDEIVCVPHPEIKNRRFVLIPMKEIAASYVDPQLNLSIETLLRQCGDMHAVQKVFPPFHLPEKS